MNNKADPRTPLQLRAEHMIREDELEGSKNENPDSDKKIGENEISDEEERKENEPLLEYLQRHTRSQIKKCFHVVAFHYFLKNSSF
jgi:hypothetical protein